MKIKISSKNYLHKLIICLGIGVLILSGQITSIAQGTDVISIASLRQHMDSIASDVTEGRFTASTGYKRAAEYSADVFKEAGLKPAYLNEKIEKSYFQPVPFIRYNYAASSIAIRRNGMESIYKHAHKNFVILSKGKHYGTAPVTSPVFIGYGINEPENGWDDYSGIDMEGRWAIILNGIPPFDTNPLFPENLRKKYSNWKVHDSLKLDALNRHKAAGLIVLTDKHALKNWEKIVLNNYRFNYMHYAKDEENSKSTSESEIPVILIHPDLVQTLFVGQPYNPVVNEGICQSFIFENTEIHITIDCKEEFVNCYNVAAVVPGTDPVLRNEYITVGAHLDHLGKIGDHVYNGANDDASGCAIILEASRAMASNPPKRSVLFILYTSEEQNLIGSKHLLKNPPIPIETISLNINIEQIGSKHRDFTGIWAIGDAQFEQPFFNLKESFSETELKFDPIEGYKKNLKGKVDLWSYYEKGIPVVMLSSGGFPEHHTIQDKIELIDFEHLCMSSKFLYAFITELDSD
jgi:hypothetical protein